MKHVIIGAGAAGLSAARTIREQSARDEIVVISGDGLVASRCMLHHYISGERDEESLCFVPGDFFSANGIKWLRGIGATGVDPQAQTVRCGKLSVGYDRLLIATGSRSAIPPVGALRTAKNVFGLRGFADAKAIREAVQAAERVVILGAGLVGMSCAYALHALKKDITLTDVGPRVLPLNLDERAAMAYQDLFEAAGCRFHLGVGIAGTLEDAVGNVTSVELTDGSLLPCDMVIMAAGVRPSSGLIAGSGIAGERSIAVDEYLCTNIPGIYAAGDVAGLSSIWPNAVRQGVIAARNMCGEAVKYTDSFALKHTINFFGLVTLSVGALNPSGRVTVETREDRNVYQRVVLRDGRVAGVILQGDISHSGFWQYLIKNAIRVDRIGKPIWKLSYADFCALDKSGEYIWAT